MIDQNQLLHNDRLSNGNTEAADVSFLNSAHPVFRAHLESEYPYGSLSCDLN